MVDTLQNAYKARLFKMFVLNASFIVRILWGLVESFMDPNTKAKLCLTSEGTHQELRDLAHPSQLEKVYGGLVDPPKVFWPPILPPGFREDFNEKHMTIEEFKKELLTNPQIVPSPELASFVRENRKCKKGNFERKVYALPTKIERRDSLNGIIPENIPKVEPEKPKEEPKPASQEIQVIEKIPNKAPEIKIEAATNVKSEPQIEEKTAAPIAPVVEAPAQQKVVETATEQKKIPNTPENNTSGSSGKPDTPFSTPQTRKEEPQAVACGCSIL